MTENNDEDILILSIQCRHPGPIPWGSIKYPCSECGAQVWLAPSSQRRLQEAKQVICFECFNKEYAGEEYTIVPHSEDAKQEIIDKFGYYPNIDQEQMLKRLKDIFKEE